LILDFVGVFAFAFVEPQMVFYLYEELGWTTIQFGVVVGMYGLAMVAGQAGLGQSSDRFGRKPVIVLGVLLTASFYAGMATVTSFALLLGVALVAGLGSALTSPALSAYYLDITPEAHRSRVVGLKESAASLGGVTGPLLVVGATGLTTAKGVFIIACALMLAASVLALTLLRAPRRAIEETSDLDWECSSKRAMAAQGALRGVVLSASNARKAQVGV
jgi:MFS family permease